jgi:hypothetical protein
VGAVIGKFRALTARENHPDEVHKEVISPKIQKLRSRICNLLVVVIEHASSIVENKPIDLADTYDDLEGVAERVACCDECCNNKAEWSPCKLFPHCQHTSKLPFIE